MRSDDGGDQRCHGAKADLFVFLWHANMPRCRLFAALAAALSKKVVVAQLAAQQKNQVRKLETADGNESAAAPAVGEVAVHHSVGPGHAFSDHTWNQGGGRWLLVFVCRRSTI
jgi:hypothetical protein